MLCLTKVFRADVAGARRAFKVLTNQCSQFGFMRIVHLSRLRMSLMVQNGGLEKNLTKFFYRETMTYVCQK